MSEKIIITTEEVEVDKLAGRDKQIFDFAYKKGFEEAVDYNKTAIVSTIGKVGVVLALGWLIFLLIHGGI